jgi:hypothetical protein
VHTTIDFNQASDVKSIIDHWVYEIIGQNEGGAMPSSSISTAALAAPGVTVAATNAADPTAMAQWVANYNAAIAAGDTATANYWAGLIQQAAGGSTSFNLSSFLTTNWPWLAAGAGAIFVLKDVV